MSGYVIDMPGSFLTFWTGTGVAQGQLWSDVPAEEAGARELRAAFDSAPSIRRGRGVSYRLVLHSREAVECLLDYAETNISINESVGADERDYSELRAARRILAQCEEVLR